MYVKMDFDNLLEDHCYLHQPNQLRATLCTCFRLLSPFGILEARSNLQMTPGQDPNQLIVYPFWWVCDQSQRG